MNMYYSVWSFDYLKHTCQPIRNQYFRESERSCSFTEVVPPAVCDVCSHFIYLDFLVKSIAEKNPNYTRLRLRR